MCPEYLSKQISRNKNGIDLKKWRFTFGRFETIRKRLISPFSHEFPLVIFEFTFDYLVIEIFQGLRVFDLGEGRVHLAHIEETHLAWDNAKKNVQLLAQSILNGILNCHYFNKQNM